jgi:O-antigen polymerase
MSVTPNPRVDKVTLVILLAFSATAVAWNTDPLLVWGYEIAIFTLTAIECFRLRQSNSGERFSPFVGFPIAAIALWGFIQVAVGATDYRWATINAGLQNAALAATALGAFLMLQTPHRREAFLRMFCCAALLIALTGVLAYWTSPGKILWIFSTVYPDNWGPFPSRNNFAQFLELCFPVALHEMTRHGEMTRQGRNWTASIAPAVMLGAGLASASRAGAALLVAEAFVVLWIARVRLRPLVLAFVGFAVAFAAVGGAAALAHRLAQADPLELRREIYRSSVVMIAQRPWRGYGLGTFATVYPEFAEFDSGAAVEHAHNDWLEWTAEGGVFYVAMWACIAIWAVRPALRSVWGIGVPVVFIHALVDYPFARLGVSAWAFLLIGALAREAEKTPRRELLSKWRTW